MKSLSQSINEKFMPVWGKKEVLPLSTIDPKQAEAAIKTGQADGDKTDDTAAYKKVKVAVKKLKAAQTEIIPEKAIGMAIGMMLGSPTKIGGDLGSIISADFHIMDGHHRWAATYLCDPNATVEGTQIGLDGIPLVSALNIITKGLHKRSGNQGHGNIKDFTGKVIGAILDDYLANGIPGKFPISAEEVRERLGRVPGANGDVDKGKQLMCKNADALPKQIMKGAPARIDMPVIDPEEVKAAAEMLKKGEVDLTNPFSEETSKLLAEHFVANFDDVNEAVQYSNELVQAALAYIQGVTLAEIHSIADEAKGYSFKVGKDRDFKFRTYNEVNSTIATHKATLMKLYNVNESKKSLSEFIVESFSQIDEAKLDYVKKDKEAEELSEYLNTSMESDVDKFTVKAFMIEDIKVFSVKLLDKHNLLNQGNDFRFFMKSYKNKNLTHASWKKTEYLVWPADAPKGFGATLAAAVYNKR